MALPGGKLRELDICDLRQMEIDGRYTTICQIAALEYAAASAKQLFIKLDKSR